MQPSFLINTPGINSVPSNTMTTANVLARMLDSTKCSHAYLLTGFIPSANSINSGFSASTVALFQSICQWVQDDSNRKFLFLVGLWGKPGDDPKKIIDDTANDVATLLHKSVKSGSIHCKTRGVWNWHAKAFGLSQKLEFGDKNPFGTTKAAVFGSSNFSTAALYGQNFELDFCLFPELPQEKEDPQYIRLLDDYSRAVNAMVYEAGTTIVSPNPNTHVSLPSHGRNRDEKGFHDLVRKKFHALTSNPNIQLKP